MYDKYDPDYLAVKDTMAADAMTMCRATESSLAEIMNAYEMTVAMEADSPEGDPEAPGAGAAATSKLKEIATKLMEKLLNIVEGLIQKLKNFVNRMIMTDKGYKTTIRHAEVDRKPLKAIKVIMRDYNPDAVFAIFDNFDKVVSDLTSFGNLIELLKDKTNPLNLPANQFEAAILSQLHLPNEVDSFDTFSIYIRKIFRGKKTEKTILQSELRLWLQRAAKTDGVQQLVNGKVEPKRAKVAQIKRQIDYTIARGVVGQSTRTELMRVMTNITKLYARYSAVATLFFDLYLEFVVASRVITKRFYQI